MERDQNVQWFDNPSYETTKKIDLLLSLVALIFIPSILVLLLGVAMTLTNVAIIVAMDIIALLTVRIAGLYRCPVSIGFSSEHLRIIRGPLKRATIISRQEVISTRTRRLFPLFKESRNQVWVLMKIRIESSLLNYRPLGLPVSVPLAKRIIEFVGAAKGRECVQVKRGTLDTPQVGLLLIVLGFPTLVLGVIFLWLTLGEFLFSNEPPYYPAVVFTVVEIGMLITGLVSIIRGYRLACAGPESMEK